MIDFFRMSLSFLAYKLILIWQIQPFLMIEIFNFSKFLKEQPVKGTP